MVQIEKFSPSPSSCEQPLQMFPRLLWILHPSLSSGWADFGSPALVFKRLSHVCGPYKNKSPKETNVMW